MEGPKYEGVNKETGKSMWRKDILDEDGNVTGHTTTEEYSEATQYLCDNPIPDLYGGFGTSIDFYGFDFSASFTYSIGGLSYDSGYAGLMSSPTSSASIFGRRPATYRCAEVRAFCGIHIRGP